jgi:phosphate transport system permease protein
MSNLARRRRIERAGVTVCALALAVALIPLAHVIYTAVSIGGSKLNWTFFSQSASGLPYTGSEGGVLNGIAGTAILIFLGCLVSVPFGVVGGLYLADFGGGPLGSIVRTAGDTLLSVPSILWGVFGFQLISDTVSPFGLHWNLSALSGGLILGLIMTPVIARVTELSLREVPNSFREASLALGATRFHTMRRISIRVALPGIATGVMLAVTNALGQTVAILLTNGYTSFVPHWPIVGQNNNVTDLGTMIYVYLNQPTPTLQPPAEAAALVLLMLALAFSLISRAVVNFGGKYAR